MGFPTVDWKPVTSTASSVVLNSQILVRSHVVLSKKAVNKFHSEESETAFGRSNLFLFFSQIKCPFLWITRLGTKNPYHILLMNLQHTNQFPMKTTKPSDSMPYPGLNCWKILPFKGQPLQVFYITSSTLHFLQVCFRGVPYSWLETYYFHSKLSGPYLNTSPWVPEFTKSCPFLCCVE